MNIIYKWGVYVNNRLLMIDAQLNTDINYYKKLKEVLKVKSLSGVELIRIGGSLADGHYIMANHFKKNQVAYSFGIDREISWDNAMADKGYQIYMYDNTIEAQARHGALVFGRYYGYSFVLVPRRCSVGV